MIFSTAEPDQYGKRFLSFLNEEAIEWIFSFKSDFHGKLHFLQVWITLWKIEVLHLSIMRNLGSNLDNLKHFSAWQSALARQKAYLCNSQVTCSFRSLSFSRGSRCAFNSLLGRTSPLAKVDWIGVIFNKNFDCLVVGNYKTNMSNKAHISEIREPITFTTQGMSH